MLKNAETPFPVSVPLSWENPKEAALLAYISEAIGEEYAMLATLPEDEYREAMRYLRDLNQPFFDSESAKERAEENRFLDEYESNRQ